MAVKFTSENMEQYLLLCLQSKGEVSVPNLGTFELVNKSARIDYASNQIFAPYRDIEFDSKHKNEVPYLNRYFSTYHKDITPLEFSAWLSEYVVQVKKQLNSNGDYDLKNIGKLRTTEGFKLIFESDPTYWGESSVEGLSVQFTPVKRLFKESEQQEIEVEPIEEQLIIPAVSTRVVQEIPEVTIEEEITELTEEANIQAEAVQEEEIQEEEIQIEEEEIQEEEKKSIPTPLNIITPPITIKDFSAEEIDIEKEIEENTVLEAPAAIVEETIIHEELEKVEAIAAIKLTAQSTSESQKEVSTRETEKPSELESTEAPVQKRRFWGIAASIAILGLLAWSTIQLFDYMNTNKNQAQNQEIKVPQDRLNQGPSEAVVRVVPTDSNSGDSINKSGNILSSSKAENKGLKVETEDKTTVESLVKEAKPIVETKKSIALEKQSNITTKIKKADQIKASELSAINSNYETDCIVVVGAFKRNSNLNTMKNKLEQAGLKTFIDSSRSLSRIGFYSDCKEPALENNVIRAKEKINSKAWVLKR